MRGIADTVYAADSSFNDWLYNVTFGQPSPSQVKAIQDATYNQVIQAGGNPQQAQSAANQAAGVATAGGASTNALWLLGAAALGAIVLIKVL